MSRILVVVAHPDDVDYGAAGTVARWTGEGHEVHYCVVTSGESGRAPAGLSRAEIGALRRAEQEAAARMVGVREVVFLGHPDGLVEPGPDLRRELARRIRMARPDLIVTHHPQRNLRRLAASHPDHLATGEAVLRAVYPDARTPGAFPELADAGLQPWTVPEVWLMTGRDSNRRMDITTTIEKKVAAVLAHRSQHEDPAGVADDLRRWAATTAATATGACGDYAESFLVLDTRG